MTDAAIDVPVRSHQRVLVVSTGTMLEAALLVHDGLDVTSMSPADYQRTGSAAAVDVIIFDGHAPTQLPAPPVDVMLFGAAGPIETRGEIAKPRITHIDDAHPLMRDLDLSAVVVSKSLVLVPDTARGDAALVRSARDVIAVARMEPARKIVAFGFALDAGTTDLTLRTAFPLLLLHALAWFARD